MGDWMFGLITGIILTVLVGWAWRRRELGPVLRKRRIRVIEERWKGEDERRGRRRDE